MHPPIPAILTTFLMNEIFDNYDPYAVSATWPSGLERRFYDDYDRKVNGSPPNLVSLLRPWIK